MGGESQRAVVAGRTSNVIVFSADHSLASPATIMREPLRPDMPRWTFSRTLVPPLCMATFEPGVVENTTTSSWLFINHGTSMCTCCLSSSHVKAATLQAFQLILG